MGTAKKYDEVKQNLEAKGYHLDISQKDFNGVTTSELICHDDSGYKYSVVYDSVMCGKKHRMLKGNKYAIYNINKFLENNNDDFVCISDKYINGYTDLEFVCNKCGKHIFKPWRNVNRNGCNRRHIVCPNCGERTESVHALVLKQMFKHYYPDTIEEEKSCRNPLTGKIMPTDIVCISQNIAIEIQSGWHDNQYSKIKDEIKKQFWIDRGYNFYALDIRDYTILEMCQIFFNITEIPDFINYEYSNKINIKLIQQMLNDGMKVPEIEKELSINRHRIYDAIYAKKLHMPDHNKNACFRPVVQLDLNGEYIAEFDALVDIQRETGIKASNVCSALGKPTHFSSGYYWIDKYAYYAGNYEIIGHRGSDFLKPIDVYDSDWNFIKTYETIKFAAEDIGIRPSEITEILHGNRKSAKGYHFKEPQ